MKSILFSALVACAGSTLHAGPIWSKLLGRTDTSLEEHDPIIDDAIRDNVIACAQKYQGKIRHIISTTKMVQKDYSNETHWSVNSFRTLFTPQNTAKSKIREYNIPRFFPSYYTDNHRNQHTEESIKWYNEHLPIAFEIHDSITRNTPLDGDQMLSMNCLEFCLLALIDANVLSREQAIKLCEITHTLNISRNEEAENAYDLMFALSPKTSQSITKDNQPRKGDILFVMPPEKLAWKHKGIPLHAALYIENDLCIENDGFRASSSDVHEASLSEKIKEFDKDDNRFTFLSLEKVADTVNAFIKAHEKCLDT